MSRGQGRVYRPTWTENGVTRTAATWWIDYSVNGKRHKENAHTRSYRAALDLLHQRRGNRKAGTLLGNPDKVALHHLRELHEKQFTLDGLRTADRIGQQWDHLEAFFGKETRVGDVTTPRLDDYAVFRLGEGAARQTVNNELSSLRRGFNLGIEKGLIASKPVFKLPSVENARSGFFEAEDIAAVLRELPEPVRPVVRFLYATGWRVSEALRLTWAHVDRDAMTVRLGAAETKGKEGRVFPYGEAPVLKALIEERWAARDGFFVFHRSGRRIKDFRNGWDGACERAGFPGRLVHDLRRSAAREFRRAGLSETDIMELCGWETRSMFERYAIRDESHLGSQVGKRFNGQGAAKVGASAHTA